MPETSKSSINLLTADFRERKNSKLFSRASIAVLGGYIIILLAIFGISFYLTSQKNNLTTQTNELLGTIKQNKDPEELLTIVKDRVKVAQNIYSKGAPTPSELVNNAVALLPQGVSLMHVSIDKSAKVSLVVKSPNSSGINEFLNVIRTTQLSSVHMNTLAYDTEGNYVVSLEITP